MHTDTPYRALAWELVILVFSLITLVFLTVDTLFELTAETSRLFFLIDTLICFVFLADVAYRGIIQPGRARYWRWGWIDLLSSIPAVAFFRWGRVIRIIRIARVLRAFRSARAVLEHLFHNPARGTAFTVSLAMVTLIMFGSIVILNVEASAPGTNIATAADALWWAFVTVTTVGYGDYYPVSNTGRIVAAILMAGGVGLFGTLTAFLANTWIGQSSENDEARQLREQLSAVVAKLERLEQAQTPPPPVGQK